jgi:hypothetical protein
MKKTILILFLAIVAVNANDAFAKPSTVNHVSVVTAHEKNKLTQKEADQLYGRLKEMRALDARALSKEQKRELRKEVLSIKERLSDPWGGGVYISAGALILIIILLIIFL